MPTATAPHPHRCPLLTSAINGLLATVDAPEPAHLLIAGAPGLGRTLAVQHAATVAAARGFAVETSVDEDADPAGPALICIDDLDCLGAAELAVVWRAVNRIDPRGIGWLATFSATAQHSAFSDLLRRWEQSLGARRIDLTPLNCDATADLLVELGRAPTADDFRLTGGIPALVVALTDGPEALHSAAEALLQRLSTDAQAVVSAAAALPARFSGTDLAVATGARAGHLITVVGELIGSGVLRDNGHGQLSFATSTVRAAALRHLDPPRRRAIRRRATQASLAAHRDPQLGATARLLATEPGPRSIADETLLRTAIGHLRSFDPESAGRLASMLLVERSDWTEDTNQLARDAVGLLTAAGRDDDVDRLLQKLAQPRRTPAAMHTAAGELAAAPFAPLARRMTALSDLLVLAHTDRPGGEPLAGVAAYAHVISGKPWSGRSTNSFYWHLAHVAHHTADGEFEQALQQLERLERADGEFQHLASLWRCELLASLDQFDEAADLADRQAGLAANQGLVAAGRQWQIIQARHAVYRGELARAETLFDAVLRDPQHVVAAIAAGDLALRLTSRDDLIHRADEACAAALAAPLPESQRHAIWFRARRRQRHRGTTPPWPHAGIVLPSLGRDPLAELALTRLAMRFGDRQTARAAAELAGRRARSNPSSPSLAAAALNAAGLVTRDPLLLEAAADRFRGSRRVLGHADALEDLGECLPRRESIDPLRQALVIFKAAGASVDARRVSTRLRDLGVGRRARATPRHAGGWPSLTPTELAVVRLVASGRTNRGAAAELDISPHTISTHLRHTFTKLGIASRIQLARVVLEHDAEPGRQGQE